MSPQTHTQTCTRKTHVRRLKDALIHARFPVEALAARRGVGMAVRTPRPLRPLPCLPPRLLRPSPSPCLFSFSGIVRPRTAPPSEHLWPRSLPPGYPAVAGASLAGNRGSSVLGSEQQPSADLTRSASELENSLRWSMARLRLRGAGGLARWD